MNEQIYQIKFNTDQDCIDFMLKYEEITAHYLWLDAVIRDYQIDTDPSLFDLISTDDLDIIAVLLSNNIVTVCNYARGATIDNVEQISATDINIAIHDFIDVSEFFSALLNSAPTVTDIYQI